MIGAGIRDSWGSMCPRGPHRLLRRRGALEAAESECLECNSTFGIYKPKQKKAQPMLAGLLSFIALP
ncbi:hypothetical protein RCO48_27735 [Peribacillus frigoritolerans]|nr:hypothetical protein [Peribacillus frigoritolerans]